MFAPTEYYQLITDSYSFYLTIVKNKGVHTLSIGGNKSNCVSVSINTPDSLLVERGYHKLDTATLPILAWDSQCAINPKLERGTGTIHMIQTALSEAKKRYPYVKQFTLTDNSTITCDNNKAITLMFFSIAEHSKTWYERHFGAHILDSKLRNQYTNGITILNDATLKLDWDSFESLIKPYTTAENIAILKPYYIAAETYADFFTQLMEKEGKRKLCVYIVNWIDIFFVYIFQFDPTTVMWAIPADSVGAVPIIEETRLNSKPKNQSGGHKTQRKNRAKRIQRVNISDAYEL
jgi:hypothetical protein